MILHWLLSRLFAEEFTRAFLEGESTPGIDYEWALYQRFMPGIELDEVNQVGQNWLLDDDRVVLVTMPDRAELTLPTEQELLAAMELGDDAWLRPYVDTTVDRPLISVEPEPGSVVEETEIPELGVTAAEMDPAEKNRVSHRGRALKALMDALRETP